MITQIELKIIDHNNKELTMRTTPIEIELFKGGSYRGGV